MKNNRTASISHNLRINPYFLLVILLTIVTSCSTAVDYTLLSKNAYDENLYDEAIINANLAISENPEYSYSWLWLGMSQLKNNQYQKAIDSLSKARELNSDTEIQKSITFHIGYAYYRISDCDNAITFYNQNIALEPDWMSYLHRSYCYIDKGMFDEALSDAHHVIQHINSKNDDFEIQAYRVMAFSHLALGNTDKAYIAIKQLQEKFPHYDTWVDLVAIAESTGDKKRMNALLLNRGWLGLESIDYLNDETLGAEIDSFVYNNPGSESKLLPGDIIISLNDIPVANASDLINAIKIQRPDYPANIKALRLKKPEPTDNIEANPAEANIPAFEKLEVNITVKSVPSSIALAILKDHPFLSNIQKKKDYYKTAVTAANSGDHKKAFDLYMASSTKHWMDSDTLSKVIELYWEIGKLIPATDKADKDAYFANTNKNKIKNITDLNDSIDRYRSIIQTTPWWADMYFELAELYERRKDYRLAASSLQLYLIAAVEDNVEVVSGESKSELVQKKIFNLEYKASNI
ncbi:MAG: tetratricopeptide repeat protein [Anaerolineae bacterium]|nr:tetratricopeptide repeat protein [Anaerolineae bacterium]